MRVKIHPTLFAYLFAVCCLSSPFAGIAMVTALAVHEFSHYVAARALHEPIERVEIAPFGGMMTYAPGRSASKGIPGVLIAAAGPIGNYAMILFILNTPLRHMLGENVIRQMLIANLSMIVLNLMPALPLDGGTILFSVGYYVCSVSRLIAVLCAMGVLLGVAMMALAAYGTALVGKFNVSLLVVGSYLVVCAQRSRAALLTQNVYAVVQERMEGVKACRRVTAYRIAGDVPILALLPWIARSQSAIFWVDEHESAGRLLLDERVACRIMLENPQMAVADAAKMAEKSKENSRK